MKRLPAVLGLLLAAHGVVAAQETTGRIGGRVLSSDGAALVEVEVTVSSDRLLGTRRTVTDRNGRFLLLALPVGAYRVDARLLGFRPVAVDIVPVRLGATTDLSRILLERQGAIAMPELTITAEAAGLDPASTASRTTLDATTLGALPLERDFSQILLLAPDAAPSYLGDGINVAGATGLENNYFVDGVNITDPIDGGVGLSLPYNFVREIEMRSGGSSAEDAQALGGVVNVVTPSGGNRFRGDAFAFVSTDALETAARPVAGATQSGFSFYDIGLSVGGPIRRDQLWFFAAYNPTYERRDHAYGFGTLADLQRRHRFAAKLTWRPGDRTSVTLTGLGDPTHRDNTSSLGSGIPLNPEVLATAGTVGGTALAIQARHSVSPTLLLEASAARTTRSDRSEPSTDAGWAPVFVDHVTGTQSGGHGIANRFESWRATIAAGATLMLATHTVRAGVAYDLMSASLAFEMSRQTAGGIIERADSVTYSWFEFEGSGTLRNRQPSFYLEDAWQLSPRVLLSGGLRWSSQTLVDASADTTVHNVADGLQPRVGIVVQPGRIGRQRFFASFARIADQLSLRSATYYGPGYYCSTNYPQDPRTDTTGATANFCFTGNVGPVGEKDLHGVISNEWAIGYEQSLGAGLIARARVVRRSLEWITEDGYDTTGTLRFGNPGEGALGSFPRAARTYEALEILLRHVTDRSGFQVAYTLSQARGNYTGQYATDLRVPAAHSGPQFDVPGEFANGNATGLLPNDRTHVLKAFGSRQFPAGITLGLTMLVASGTPLSEYGSVPEGAPYRNFASQRGSVGRTPATWDLGVRASYDLPRLGAHLRPRVLLDVQHIGSPRRAVDYDQLHYACLDASTGAQSCPSASYGSVTQYQPPMVARVGIVLGF